MDNEEIKDVLTEEQKEESTAKEEALTKVLDEVREELRLTKEELKKSQVTNHELLLSIGKKAPTDEELFLSFSKYKNSKGG